MTIQAIETSYAGYRFRSRLEARWAVFFDHLNIKWEYEPQGYVVGGEPYLPDFLLVECGTWIEVKGDPQHLDKKLMYAAALDLPCPPGRRGGEPGPRIIILGPIPEPTPSGGGDWGWVGLNAEDVGNSQLEVFPSWYGFGNFRENRRPWVLVNTSMAVDEDGDWLVPAVDPYEDGVPEAYAAARSSRFEHGEWGAV